MSENKTSRLALIAVLIASASALQVVEAALPRFLPWLKIGFANVITLYALLRLSFSASVCVAVFRTLIGALFLGTFFSAAHAMSFAGAVASALAMYAALKVYSGISLTSLSIAGAIANNCAQLFTVQFLFAADLPIWGYFALSVWVGLPSGFIVALTTAELLKHDKYAHLKG